MRLLLQMPVISKKVKEKICEQVYQAFGGRAYEVIVGGAALSREVEQFLVNIGFPITVGYGATECAPLISYSDYKDFIPASCGTPVDHMEVRIDSADPEIQHRRERLFAAASIAYPADPCTALPRCFFTSYYTAIPSFFKEKFTLPPFDA